MESTNQDNGEKRKNILYWLVSIPVFLGFLFLYMYTLHDCSKVFNKSVNVIFYSDTGEYALLTQTPLYSYSDYSNVEKLEFDPFTNKKKMKSLYRELHKKNRHVNKTQKHLLTHYINHYLYLVGKKCISLFVGRWNVGAERLAIIFPSAFFGALTVLMAFIFFSKYTERLSLVLIFTGFLGFSLGKWIFSSIPESYSIQCAAIIVFIFYLFRMGRFDRKEVIIASFLAGLTILVGVNNVLLIPGALLLFVFNKKYKEIFFFLSFTGFIVFFGYWLMSTFVNPQLDIFDSIMKTVKHINYFGTKEHAIFSSFFYKPLFTLLNFLFLSVGAIMVPMGNYYAVDAFKYYFQSPIPFLFFIFYVFFLFLLVKNIPGTQKKDKPYLFTLGTWLLCMFIFYTLFNANESILYSSLFLVPFWILVFFLIKEAKFSLFGYDMVSPVLYVLVLILFINNFTFLRNFIAPL